MTQLEYARRGVITEKMRIAALSEGVPPEFIRDGIAAGTIVICHNRVRLSSIGQWNINPPDHINLLPAGIKLVQFYLCFLYKVSRRSVKNLPGNRIYCIFINST